MEGRLFDMPDDQSILSSASADPVRDREFVQSLERGLLVMQSFDGENPRMTLSQVAQRTGMTRAAARRFLLTLQATGYVGSDGRDFFLQSKVLELGASYLASLKLPEVAQRHLQDLARMSGESCSVSILEGRHVVYVARFDSVGSAQSPVQVGTRVTALDSAMGIVHLAALAPQELEDLLDDLVADGVEVPDRVAVVESVWRAKHQGWFSLNDGPNQSLAVPVRNSERRVIAAIEICTVAGQDEAYRPFVVQLLKSAEEIVQALREMG